MKNEIVENSTIIVPRAVLEAVLSQERVDEAPHNFYKYPARFSPAFAREAIKAFTDKGDTVLDPFCGGGTSLVEAISLGRRAAGFDISSLAAFISRVKTTPISIHDKRKILEWKKSIYATDVKGGTARMTVEEEAHYLRNLPAGAQSFFEAMRSQIELLTSERQRQLVRLALLAVGQWALDCKMEVPDRARLQSQFSRQVTMVVDKHFDFISSVAEQNELSRGQISQTRRIINKSCEESEGDGRIPASWLPAKLVLTSPPYPGVHVVYHRWQINGRKETPAPFWLANCRDGAGESFYCLGRRSEPKLKTYFERLGKAFTSVGGLIASNSLVVQLVAFSSPDWQLPAYLKTMEEAGFLEALPVCDEKFLFQGRIWRDVPGRKWYAKHHGKTASSQEVLLLHRKRII